MSNRPHLTVRQAAERLGLSAEGVRWHAAAGRLGARRLGRQWWLDAREVERMARQGASAGRPMSAEMAWAILHLASGDEAAAERIVKHVRYRARPRNWLASHSLVEDAARLRHRALTERFDAHPSEIARVLRRSDVLATGISAGEAIGLVGGDRVAEVYAPAGHRDELIEEHALESGEGPVRIRWVPDDLWASLDANHVGRAPRAAILLDLLEHDDPRARREAAGALGP